ncbi:MAG: hypothetical protein ACN6OP_25015, partial [Pseudomonadales bacterium]
MQRLGSPWIDDGGLQKKARKIARAMASKRWGVQDNPQTGTGEMRLAGVGIRQEARRRKAPNIFRPCGQSS